MDSFHVFVYLWLGGVALLAVGNLAWAIREGRAGVSEVRYFGPYFRDDEPFGFWSAVGAKLAIALVLAPFLFWHGLEMLRR